MTGRRMATLVAAVWLAVAARAPGSAHAGDGPGVVALAPLSSLGGAADKRTLTRVERDIRSALSGVPDTTVVDGKAMLDAIAKAKRAELRTCDGDAGCLADLGALIGANRVVYGEIGGIGKASIAYLKLIDVGARRELRSTTIELGANAADETRAAAVRLLAPTRYVGKLALAIDVKGASVYVDGSLQKLAGGSIELPVGSHALRVTHPEYRDFVRFVDVTYGAETKLSVELQGFPIVASDMRKDAADAPIVIAQTPIAKPEPTPWYRRWYTVAGGTALVFLTSAVVFAAVNDGVDADVVKTLP